MLGGTADFFYETCWLTITKQLGGRMNFVDAKQQGVIRFLGQNEKLAKQLATLAGNAGADIARKQFAGIVASDIFKLEDHPFKEKILSGKRSIATMKVYHAIELVRDGHTSSLFQQGIERGLDALLRFRLDHRRRTGGGRTAHSAAANDGHGDSHWRGGGGHCGRGLYFSPAG